VVQRIKTQRACANDICVPSSNRLLISAVTTLFKEINMRAMLIGGGLVSPAVKSHLQKKVVPLIGGGVITPSLKQLFLLA
jgi:hypothetical protein